MLKEVTMHQVVCDNCQKEYCDDDTGAVAYTDKGSAEYVATESGWQKIDDKHYCPDCTYYDDNDELAIILERTIKN